MIATLPMYDWPEIRHETDALWVKIRDVFHANSVAAPEKLDRTINMQQSWLSDDLVFSQTCGLPYVSTLRGKVELICTPDYGLPNCPIGHYNSVLIVRADDARSSLEEFRGARFAANGEESQSGYQALAQILPDGMKVCNFFNEICISGAHSKSIEMVAQSKADIAAIDHVSWRYAKRYMSETNTLRVVSTTPSRPALPYIARKGADVQLLAGLVETAIDQLDIKTKETLGIRGIWRSTDQDYNIIAASKV